MSVPRPTQVAMAGEVTRRQQKLQIPAEHPPIFVRAGTPSRETEKAKVVQEISNVCDTNAAEENMGMRSQEALFWTKAKRKSKLGLGKYG